MREAQSSGWAQEASGRAGMSERIKRILETPECLRWKREQGRSLLKLAGIEEALGQAGSGYLFRVAANSKKLLTRWYVGTIPWQECGGDWRLVCTH